MDADHVEALGTERISKLIVRYSMPTMLSTVVNASYNVADRIFVGRTCGEDALAAITVCFSPTLFLLAVAMTIGHGSATMISICLGAGRREAAEKFLGQAVFLFGVFYAVVAAAALSFMPQILTFFGATPKILPDACAYYSIIIGGLIFDKISFGVNNLVRAEGRPVVAMATILIGGATNVFLDWLFLVKWNWGVRGAAIATVIAQACASAWVIGYYFSGRNFLKIRLRNFRAFPRLLRQMASAGSPSFIIQAFAALSVSVFVVQARSYGSESALAVIGVCTTVTTFLFLPIVGLSMGVQPIVGYNWGAKNFKRVRRAFSRALWAATAVCAAGFALAELFPGAIFELFLGSDSPLLSTGEGALRLMVAGMAFIGANIVASGYFQATKRPAVSIFVTTLRQIIFLVPAMLLLPRILGLDGLWASFPIGDISAFFATLFFIVREMRSLRRKVGEEEAARARFA